MIAPITWLHLRDRGHRCALREACPEGEIRTACRDAVPYELLRDLTTADPGVLGCEACRDAIATAARPIVVRHPSIKGGQPTVRGTRITVDCIVNVSESGDPLESLVAEFGITPDMIVRALEWDRGFKAGRRQSRRGAKARGRR